MALCGEKSSYDYQCTRDRGHSGSHVATGVNNRVLDTWGLVSSPPESAPSGKAP